MADDEHCIDCDRPDRDCVCEDRLRCSCGLPDSACVCAGPTRRNFTTDEWAEVLRQVTVVDELPKDGKVVLAHPSQRARALVYARDHEIPCVLPHDMVEKSVLYVMDLDIALPDLARWLSETTPHYTAGGQ